MSTQGADLDDKRVIFTCWVGHLKDSHFAGSSMERSMMEENRMDRETDETCVCVCVCVCVWYRGDRENKQPVGKVQQRIECFSFYLPLIWTNVYTTHKLMLMQILFYWLSLCSFHFSHCPWIYFALATASLCFPVSCQFKFIKSPVLPVVASQVC